MINRNIVWCTFFALITVISCRKEKLDQEVEIYEETPRVYHNAHVNGKVSNVDGEPLSALVKIGDRQIESGSNGAFDLQDLRLNARGAVLQSYADGFLPIFKKVNSVFNEESFVEIIHKDIQSAIPLIVDQDNEIEFDEAVLTVNNDYFEYMNGDPFSGIAELLFEIKDYNEYADLAPITLLAQSAELELGTIDPKSVLAIIAFDEGGRHLRLKSGKSIQLKLNGQISSSYYALNLRKDLWEEMFFEGTGTSISSMGYFLLGDFVDKVEVRLRLKDHGDKVLDRQLVKLDFGSSHEDLLSNSNGEVVFDFKAGSNGRLVIESTCGEKALAFDFSTTIEDVNLGDISTDKERTDLTFNVYDCQDFSKITTIDQAYIVVDGTYIECSVDDQGKISVSDFFCDSPEMIQVELLGGTVEMNLFDNSMAVSSESNPIKVWKCDDGIGASVKVGDKLMNFTKDIFAVKLESDNQGPVLDLFGGTDFFLSARVPDAPSAEDVVEINMVEPINYECQQTCGVDINFILYEDVIGGNVEGYIEGEINGQPFWFYVKDERIN